MNEAITVDFETEVAIENKSTEQLTAEVNVRYRQAESLAAMSATMLADAGRRLTEIKSRIPHGQFEQWCKDNLEFSKSKAEKMMKLAEKMQDETSLFSKTETFTDLRISTVWALLAAPEEVAAEVVETENVSDMTVRELKEKLRQATADKEAAEARADQAEYAMRAPAEQELADLQHSVEHMKKERDDALQKQKIAQDQIIEIKERLKKQKAKQQEEVDKAIEKQRASIEKEVEDRLHKQLSDAEEDNRSLQEQIDNLSRKLASMDSEAFATYRVHTNTLQVSFNECLAAIEKVGEVNAVSSGKMRSALISILRTEIEALEESA